MYTITKLHLFVFSVEPMTVSVVILALLGIWRSAECKNSASSFSNKLGGMWQPYGMYEEAGAVVSTHKLVQHPTFKV